MIILIGSKKGGVGKSTIATNIAAYLACAGKDVILIDADIQRTSSNWFHDRCETDFAQIMCVQQYDNLRSSLRGFSRRYEYVIVDCQGRDSTELRTGLLVCDICIVPCKPSQADLDTIPVMSDMLKQAREINESLQAYCVLTMSPTNPAITEIADSRLFFEKLSEIKLLNTTISERKVYRDALADGKGVVESENEKAKQEIESLIKEVGLLW